MADSPVQAEGLSAEDRGLVEAVLIELASDPCCPIERLARRVCLSPSRFAHRFQEAAGLSPGAFAVAFRMQAAKELIVDTGLPVTQVAMEVGYQSLGTFTSRFTAWVGASPTRLRRLLELAPPRLAAASGPLPGDAAVRGRLIAQGAFTGVAFVGLFPALLPAAVPVSGTMAPVPGAYRLPPCPPGTYRLLAAAFAEGVGVRRLVLSIPDRVATAPAVVAPGRADVRDLVFRPTRLGDPPVVVSLGLIGSRWAPPAGQVSRIEEARRGIAGAF